MLKEKCIKCIYGILVDATHTESCIHEKLCIKQNNPSCKTCKAKLINCIACQEMFLNNTTFRLHSCLNSSNKSNIILSLTSIYKL